MKKIVLSILISIILILTSCSSGGSVSYDPEPYFDDRTDKEEPEELDETVYTVVCNKGEESKNFTYSEKQGFITYFIDDITVSQDEIESLNNAANTSSGLFNNFIETYTNTITASGFTCNNINE